MELRGSDIKSFKTKELRSLLVVVLSLAIAFTTSASSQGIDFSFQTFNDSIIQRQGDASFNSRGFIQITEVNLDKIQDKIQDKITKGSGGWATYHQPMHLWDKATGNVADFTTQFTFVIQSQNGLIFASGMTFFLVPEESTIMDKELAGGLAILNPHRGSSNSSAWFVAVEFDPSYDNNTMVVDPLCEKVRPHIGIDLNNLNSEVYSCVDWFQDKILSGGRINATITYNSSTQNLSVLMIDADPTGTDINSSAISYRVNLTEYLPEWVTFGFSAATAGQFYELHTLEAWEFRSTVQVAGTNISIPANGDAIDFSFQTFNDSIIRRQGDASFNSRGFIQITEANLDKITKGSGGWATYHKPMRLWDKATGNVADFTTQFTFVIQSQNGPIFASGMTFFLVPEESTIMDKELAGGLAILNPHRDPLNSSDWFVAVEFDPSYDSNTMVVDPLCENVRPHIGIDLNNLNSKVYSCVDWFQDKILSGGRINTTITYNSSMQNLSVLMIDADPTGTDINSSAISYRVNLPKYLPEWVTFGFSASTAGQFYELHTLEAWEFRSTVQVAETNISIPANGDAKKSKLRLWFILGSGSLIFLVLALAFIWCRHRSKRKTTDMSGEEDDPAIEEEFELVSGPRKISYKDLVAVTDNFAIERLLGEGGFGRVYEGYLTSVNANVAIKKIRPGSRQGIKEYATEVKTISRLRHKNLVQLIGWCHEEKELLLIYEFMSNGSLDSHLFKERTFLPWEKRYKIVQGIASGLLYLHEEWEQCVLHRDIKSSNIMLDSDFNAKLGDFGLARLVDHAKGLQTTVLAGTMGYMAPECVYTGKASRESDIYSFGVVLLEITCGRKVIEPRAKEGQVRLVDWVWELYGTGRILDAAESKLDTNFDEKQLECLMVVGLWCAHPDHIARPSIREAFSVLNFNAPPPILPSKLPVPFSQASIVSFHATSTSGAEVSTFTTSSVQYSHSDSFALLPNTI